MQIVHVIPIARGVGKETLSYFTARAVTKGEIVYVPLRRKIVPAVVVSFEDAGKSKSAIRSSRFALKRIDTRTGGRLLSPSFMKALEKTAQHFAGTTGATIHAIVPSVLWDPEIAKSIVTKNRPSENTATVAVEQLILQSEEHERWNRYRGLVREAFARNESLFMCVPTIVESEHLMRELEKGIGPYLYVLHSKLTKKTLRERIEHIRNTKHPIAIIGTPSFLAIERTDIRTIIVERESASAYKVQARPYIDMRVFVEHFARATRARLILADLPLRIETLFRFHTGIYEALVPPKIHPQKNIRQTVVDMRTEEKPAEGKKKEFKIIGSELQELITRTQEQKSRLFIFTARKGLSPTTVCQDCGSVVTDEVSNAPVILYRGLEENMFVSHVTGATRSAKERCRVCNSWRLVSLGIGIQRVEDEIKKHAKGATILSIDSGSTPTHRAAFSTATKFYDTENSILLGTEMALPYISSSVPYVAVASLDTLLSHPDWRMSEKVFNVLLTLRSRTKHTFLIQTRRPDEPLLLNALEGNTMDFYRDEIELRNTLRYPPFTIIIKIHTLCTPTRIKTETAWLEEQFAKHKLRVYLPNVQVSRGKYALHGILRVPHEKWPDAELVKQLRELPPHYAVSVDPASLL